VLDQEGPGHGRGDVGVVEQPEMVLQRRDLAIKGARIVAERLAHELER
jgi:hypothetical protein